VWQPEPGELQPTLVDVRVYDASRLPTWNLRDVIGILDTCYTVVETVRDTTNVALVADPDGGVFAVSDSAELGIVTLSERQGRNLGLHASSDWSRPADRRRGIHVRLVPFSSGSVLVVSLYHGSRSVD